MQPHVQNAAQIFEARRAVPEIGAEAGDVVLLRPGHSTRPLILQRKLPDDMVWVIADPGAFKPVCGSEQCGLPKRPKRPESKVLELVK